MPPFQSIFRRHPAVGDEFGHGDLRRVTFQGAIHGPADLAAEVISLGTRHRDRIEKRDLFEQHGIKEYWLIDPESETVDALWLVNSRYELAMRCGPAEIATSQILPGFEVSVRTLLRGK